MKEETKEETKKEIKEEVKNEEPKKRQIILETDGNSIAIIKSEVAGAIELIAILERVMDAIKLKMEGK